VRQKNLESETRTVEHELLKQVGLLLKIGSNIGDLEIQSDRRERYAFNLAQELAGQVGLEQYSLMENRQWWM